MEQDENYIASKQTLSRAQTVITAYNQAVKTANEIINAKKTVTAIADVRIVEHELVRLRAIKNRHTPEVKEKCEAYQTALGEKRTLEEHKEEAKKRLGEYTSQVMPQYERKINEHLDDFNAGFRITGTSLGYLGGAVSTDYKILINETAVPLGDETTPLSGPSFRNTLSSGDKSTLALAFFLAQLDQDIDKSNKIVVFDDPFNSQDSFRKEWTVQKILKCGDECHQVIVLSHDKHFLHRIWNRLSIHPDQRKTIQFSRIGIRDTKILSWDIEESIRPAYIADRKALVEYNTSGNGEPREIVKKIRPVLESFCKFNDTELFTDEDNLGIIISKIQTAGTTNQLYSILEKLEIINEYSCRYHHGDSLNDTTESPEGTELEGFVKKTLEIIGYY